MGDKNKNKEMTFPAKFNKQLIKYLIKKGLEVLQNVHTYIKSIIMCVFLRTKNANNGSRNSRANHFS